MEIGVIIVAVLGIALALWVGVSITRNYYLKKKFERMERSNDQDRMVLTIMLQIMHNEGMDVESYLEKVKEKLQEGEER
jgi:bifunctional N-acetylglucosamine-1-phosphate-uridyltransferase/glucosamine-1-phosphate-acetyltransferase GlmU-like protein